MAVLKLSKKDIIKNGEKEEKITLKRSDLSYDSAKLHGWEQSNKESLDILNKYNDRVNNKEWLSSNDLASYRKALDSYLSTSNRLRGINKTFGDGYTDEDEKSWQDSISSLNKGYDQITNFYSQFTSDKDYSKWLKLEELNSVIGAEDFEANKGYVSTKMDSWWDKLWSQYSLGYNDLSYEYINNQNGLRDEINSKYRTFSQDNSFAEAESDFKQKGYDFLTDDEVGIYNYYYSTQGKDKAQEYLDSLETTLVQRKAGKEFKNLEGRTLAEIFYGVVAGAEQWRQGVENLGSMITGDEGFTPSSQYVSGMVREDLADNGFKILGNSVGQIGYDILNTTSNMLPSILVGAATGGLGGAITLGASITGNAYTEMRHLGYDRWQATAYAGLVGASETALQYALGGISKLGGKVSGNAISKLVSKFDNAIARTAITLGGNMASEGLEEAIQTVLEPAFKALVTGEEFEAPEWEEVLYSGLLGALSAGMLEGVPTIAGTVGSSTDAKKLYGGSGVDLVNESLEIDPNNAHAKRMKAKLDSGKDISGYQLNRLVNANETALRSQDISKIETAAEARLTELGEKGDVKQLSQILAKQASGEQLTHSEKAALKNSTYGQRVANELDPENIESGEYASTWAESLDTDRINAEAYSRMVQDLDTQQVPNAAASQSIPVTENTSHAENAVEGEFEASEESIPTIERDGKEVEAKIAKIASIENGKMTVELEGGEVVDAGEVNFGTKTGLLYQAAADMSQNVAGFNLDTANVFVKGFNPEGGLSVSKYMQGFTQAYRFGAQGVPSAELEKGTFTSLLTDDQRNKAYNLGRIFSKDDVAKMQASIEKSAGSLNKKKGRVYFDGKVVGKHLTERQRASLKAIRVIAEAVGIDIHVFESAVGKDGKRQGANGWYDPSDNSIHIDLYAGVEGNGLMLFTAAHELTHHIRQVAPAKFKIFADALLEEYTKNGQSVEELINKKLETLEANGRLEGKTEEEAYDLAYEEVVADSCEAMLVDSNAFEELSRKINAKDKSLWQSIKDFIAKLVARVKAAYKELNPDSHEANLVRDMVDSAERLQKLWVDALLEASEVSVEQTLGESGIMVNPKTDSASLFSVRDLLTDADRKKVSKALAERFGVSQSEAMDWLKAETSLASLILNPKYSQYLDYTGDANEEAIKTNSDYPQGTVDFSNICKKRRAFTEVMNRVLRNFPNHVFAATDLAKIRTIMEEEGMEVACAICYVEDRRQLDSVVAQDFIDSLALYRNGSTTRPDGKAFNANQLKAFKLIEGDTYTPSIYELISLEGRNALKAKNPAMEEAWVKFNNARGMQSVRLLLNDAEYKRQILKYTPAVVNRKNDLGGLRIYSFSDMEMFHLIDIIQVITDSATVGLSLQGYTKVNEYAKAVKDTGEKLNRSLIPKGDLGYHMENGKVVLDFDTVEGIDINHPDFFDNIDNPNIGNIVIGINATQIKAAMTSKFIDQIIPFHTGQSGEVLGEKGIAAWDNYKDFQSERDAKTNKKSAHQINIYTEVINAAEAEGHPITNKVEFVNKFLEVCKENNLIPRFSDFLNVDENGDYVYTEGYHKFLVDFKTFDQNTGEYLPQMPVKPIFDNEYITKLLEDYVKTQSVKDAELAKAMPKVLDRITKEIVSDVRYSDRYQSATENSDILSMAERVESGKFKANEKVFLGTVSDSIAIQIHNLTGVNVQGFKVAIEARQIEHILKDHGKKGLADQSMSDYSNIAKMEYALNSPDDIRKSGKTQAYTHMVNGKNKTVDTVLYEKNIGAKSYYVVQAVPDTNAKTLYIVTAFIGKKGYKKEAPQLINAKSLDVTAKTGSADASANSVAQSPNFVKRKFSDRASYAPTFYSHMGKVIDGIRIEKMGAGGVVSYLKGKGVKDEEIKWSGIETFLEGKKSVTKAELQEFVAGSQLQIVEQGKDDTFETHYKSDNELVLTRNGKDELRFEWDEDEEAWKAVGGDAWFNDEDEILDAAHKGYGSTKWSEYTLEGGTNYRELVFKMPNSTYSNRAMRVHWGEDAEGVLAHARIQDFTVNGKKMLFIEEIQSDWHNEGHQKGYVTKDYEDAVAVYDKLAEDYANKRRVFNKYVRSGEFRSDPDDVSKKKFDWLRRKMDDAEKRMQAAERDVDALKEKGMGDVPDAPFRNNYHEYVLKRLLRMAAEEGYDSIGWTPSQIQSDRWSDEFAEAYRIEYDQDIPKFLRKYGKKWGATVGKTKMPSLNHSETYYDVNRQEEYDSFPVWQDMVRDELDAQGADVRKVLFTIEDDRYWIAYDKVSGIEYDRAEIRKISDSVWSMDISDSMKESVLYEGQVFYSDRVTDKKTLDFLENQEHVTVYRAMQVIDGELYPPMAAKVKSDDGKKKLVTPSKIGAWEQAVERPDLIRNGNKFELDKANGSSIQAAYNPYFHTSASPLNDQFSSAYKRPNLVIVEGEIPKSELTSGYRAEFAKDTVGETKWHSGPVASKLKGDKARRVFLSRWFKPVRIVPDSEVASIVAKTLEGEDINVPYNVVTPSLRTELEKVGVPIKYSDRNPDSFSNRSLLANALETAVQNDIEREKLKQYKEKIDLINSEEQKLHDLREQIKELSFKKGPRDTEAIRKLQFEANQAANRINTYDRQLLNLESTKALKGVLEREKKLAYQKAEKRGKEALERAKERAAKTERELMTRYQESRKKAVEGREKTAIRHKIKDVVNDLNQYLLKGTKDKHVPIELQKAVAEALDAVNMDTVGAEERIAKKRAEMMSVKTPEAVEKLAKEIEHIQEMGGNMAKKISRLKTAYDSIINSDDPLVANSHDEVISNTISRVMEYVGDTPLRDMTLPQLEAVYDMYRMVLHSIRNANKAFKAKKSEEISVIANRVMEEVDKLGNKKAYRTKLSESVSEFDWNNTKPVYAFERIGSDTFTEVFNNVREGEDIWATDMSESQEFRIEQYGKHKYDSWDFKKRYGFTSSSGMDFELSLDQIMSLYAYSKRPQAADHLKKGGIVFDETTEVTLKTKLGIPVKFNPTQATAYNISDETLADIISKLSPEQKAFVDEMQDYLSTTMGEKGNEVSLALYGVKLFKEKNYFPLKSATQFMAKAKEQQKGEVKIKNSGFSKETVPKASNPVVLTPFMDVWASHVNEMSMYHAFVLALEDFYRVYNYKTPTSETMATESVEMFIQNAYGKGATKYIDQLLTDLNGGARSDPRETFGKQMISRFKKSAVMGSLSVVVQQPTAIVRAMALVDAKHFGVAPITRGVLRTINRKKHKALWAEVKKYAPVAIIKEMGYFDTGMGQSSVEWLKGEKTFMDKVDDALSKAPAVADELAWISIWEAVKRETLQNNPTIKAGSEEFLKLCGERFTEVVTKTQVYDSTLAKSSNMRSKGTLMNMWTAFMAEPTTSINMVTDALRKGNKKYAARVLGSVVGSVALNAALVSLISAMWDDDEDETYAEKYLSRFATEFVDGINPVTYIPFFKDIWSVMQGFDIERADMSLITELVDAMQKATKVLGKDTSGMGEGELAEHQKQVSEALWGIVDSISSLAGIPEKNIRRDINGIINLFETLERDMETTQGSLMDNIVEDLKDSIPVLGWFPGESKLDKLYEAITSGDTKYVERMKSSYKSEAAYNTAVRKALRENDPRIKEAAEAVANGKGSVYSRIVGEIEAEGNFSRKDITAAIASEVEKINKNDN